MTWRFHLKTNYLVFIFNESINPLRYGINFENLKIKIFIRDIITVCQEIYYIQEECN